jgi:hypothetical protein
VKTDMKNSINNLVFLLLVLPLLAVHQPARAQDRDPDSWLQPRQGQLRWITDIGMLPARGYVVQLGVYKSKAMLESYADSEKLRGIGTLGVAIERDGETFYYLLYGPYRFEDNAGVLAEKLGQDRGIETWVRQIETIGR